MNTKIVNNICSLKNKFSFTNFQDILLALEALSTLAAMPVKNPAEINSKNYFVHFKAKGGTLQKEAPKGNLFSVFIDSLTVSINS